MTMYMKTEQQNVLLEKINFSLIKTFIDDVNLTNSTNEKIEKLVKWNNSNNSEEIKKVLFYTYNTFLNFNLTSSNLKKKHDFITSHSFSFYEVLDKLNDRSLSGHLSIRFMNHVIQRHPEYKDLIYKIIDRNLEIRVDVKTINKVFDNLIPTFSVVLANSYDDHVKKVDFTKDSWYCSRKLDGCRCITIIDENYNVKFYSREGKEFHTLNVLKGDIESLCKRVNKNNIVLDGEICYIGEDGNEDFSGIMKLITRKDFDIPNPKYYVFDLLSLEDFNKKESTVKLSERLNGLNKLLKDSNLNTVEELSQYLIKDSSEFEELKNVSAEFNWEGLMLRKDVAYKGSRVSELLKVKAFKDAEYTVEDIEIGKIRIISKETGLEQTIETMTNVIISHKGFRVSVGSGFSLEQRINFYNNPKEIIGKIITVKYFNESQDKDGKPSLRFPTVKFIHGKERNV